MAISRYYCSFGLCGWFVYLFKQILCFYTLAFKLRFGQISRPQAMISHVAMQKYIQLD